MQNTEKDNASYHPYWIVTLITSLILVTWELVSRESDELAFFISRPSEIWAALKSMALSGTLLKDFGVTTAEALIGTALGTILGSIVGLALWLSKQTNRIAAPFIVIAANFPVFALAPVAIVWLGVGMGMKIFLAALATFFVSLNLAHQGAKLAHKTLGTVFDGFRASRWDTYRMIIVPGALEAVFSSMRVSVGLGILGAFIGEFIASDAGLGRIIIRASGLYQLDRVFAAALCIIVLAALLDRMALGLQQEKLLIARMFGIPRHLRHRSRELGIKTGEI